MLSTMFFAAILLIIVCVAIAFYLDAKKRNNYWRKRGVPTVDSNFIFGMSFDYMMGRRSLEQVHEHMYAEAPDERYVGFYNMMQPGLLIRDPELIYQITVRDFHAFHERAPGAPTTQSRLAHSLNLIEGEEWRYLRQRMASIFTASKLRSMYDLVQECANALVNHHFRPSAKSGNPLDVKETTARFGLDAIGKCAFGLEFDSIRESRSVFAEVGITFDDKEPGVKSEIRRRILFDSNAVRLLGLRSTSTDVENFFDALLQEAKKVRGKEQQPRVDFLQTMLNLVKEEDEDHPINESHIISNMLVFYISTYDTTSLSIAYTLYELAMNPEVQERLRYEVEKVRDANSGVLDYDTLNEIEYLEMVISETLRLHAPTSFNFRMCTVDRYQVPDSSLELRYGDVITYSISALHKDAKYFPNPLKFDPERFSKKNIARMNPHVYQPFGSGPRICFGLRFAKLIMKVCVASALTRFRVSRCDRTESQIEFRKSGGFHKPKNGIWLSVEEIC